MAAQTTGPLVLIPAFHGFEVRKTLRRNVRNHLKDFLRYPAISRQFAKTGKNRFTDFERAFLLKKLKRVSEC